jgi:NADH:ubiquinone oxidoreductase subunit E
MIYIAVLFMCLGGNCHVMSSETAYKNKKECQAVIALEEKKQEGKFDIFEARCIGVNNGFI